jgi:hypothetical protein
MYCKWLDYALKGAERLQLPLPTTFPLHQWAKTYMGLKPLHGRDWYASESYAVIDASKVLSWEPIVQIGIREWRPKSKFLGHVPARGGRNGKRKGRDREQPPKGVGEPLFANNVHAWSFG